MFYNIAHARICLHARTRTRTRTHVLLPFEESALGRPREYMHSYAVGRASARPLIGLFMRLRAQRVCLKHMQVLWECVNIGRGEVQLLVNLKKKMAKWMHKMEEESEELSNPADILDAIPAVGFAPGVAPRGGTSGGNGALSHEAQATNERNTDSDVKAASDKFGMDDLMQGDQYTLKLRRCAYLCALLRVFVRLTACRGWDARSLWKY